MRKIALSLAVLSAMLLSALHTAPAHAANSHTWVSHSGIDGLDCAAASPCAHFIQAESQTRDGGEISCLDSGSFDQITITISLTIDCTGTLATTSVDGATSCGNGITINAPGKVVTLRGLDVIGQFGSCTTNGIFIQAAAAVYIEDCVIEDFTQKGILDVRTAGATKLAIKNTIVRNNGSAGIVVAAAPKNSVVLENVHSVGNLYGIAVATSNIVVISRSVMSENAVAGIEADAGAQVFVDNTEISHNNSYGLFALGTVVLANSDIVFNTSSISGSTISYGNNRLFGNGPGTAPTTAGGTSTDFGQQ
jgi:Right handed beta helix region